MVAYKGVSGAIKVEQCSSKDTIIDIVSDFASMPAHTNTLFVSANGNGVDGLTWKLLIQLYKLHSKKQQIQILIG